MFAAKIKEQRQKESVPVIEFLLAQKWALQQSEEFLTAPRFDSYTGQRKDSILTLLETSSSPKEGHFTKIRVEEAQKELVQIHQQHTAKLLPGTAAVLKGNQKESALTLTNKGEN